MRPFLSALIFVFLAPLPLLGQSGAVDTTSFTATVQPGDAIHLRVWREADLSGEFPVDEQGVVVLPKLGPWQVSGMNAEHLRDEITKAYSEYLKNPSIEVFVTRRITIVGAVQNPGVYQVDPTMSIVHALAKAGGPSGDAKKDEVILVRNGQERHLKTDDLAALQSVELHSDDQLVVPQRSWFARNWRVMIGLVGVAVAISRLVGG